jgi:hypothetical protein
MTVQISSVPRLTLSGLSKHLHLPSALLRQMLGGAQHLSLVDVQQVVAVIFGMQYVLAGPVHPSALHAP